MTANAIELTERRGHGRDLRGRAAVLLVRWGLVLVFAVVVGAFSAWIPNTFPTLTNLHNIVASQPPAIFAAFAAMLVLVVGEFDLSIGATLGLSEYLVLQLITADHMSWPAAVAVALAVGLVVGAINASLVVGLAMNSFIATIGVSTILTGLVQLISNGNAPIFGGAPKGLTELAQNKLLGLELPVYYALLLAIVLWILLEFTVRGREMHATGANRGAARLAGLNTRRAVVAAYLLGGLFAAIAGVILTAGIGAADATSGPSYLLPAYAAAFLGATAIRPGSFNVWGTLVAVFLVAVGVTGLQLKGVAPWVTPVFNGVVLVIAVGVSNVAARRQGGWGGRVGRARRLPHSNRGA